MIRIKHLMDAVEDGDGQRLFVESSGLTKDLTEWCHVDHVVPHLGPPRELADWYEEHPDGYEFFRARYHDVLEKSPMKPALQQMACVAARETFTLLHTGDDPSHNTATALYEFITELEAYCPPEQP